MAHVRAYFTRHNLSLLNAAVIFVVYVVGIAARPHAALAATTRIHEWVGITPEVSLALLILSALLMATPWYSAKYLALIMPGVYAAAAFGFSAGNDALPLVSGFVHGAITLMMAYGVRMEQRRNVDD